MNTTKNYSTDGGDKAVVGGALEVESGGALAVKSGGTLEVQSGGTLEIKTGATVNGLPAGPAGADAVWVEVDTPCVLIPCDAAGVAVAGSIQITANGYIGKTHKTTAAGTVTTGDDALEDEPSSTADGGYIATISWTAAPTADSGVITLNLYVDGYNLDAAATPPTLGDPIVRTIPWCKVTASGAT